MAETKRPNILVIWGDDIGTANLSYSAGPARQKRIGCMQCQVRHGQVVSFTDDP